MNDTPRTDEQINGKPCTRFAVMAGDSLRDALVSSEFARQLELELNAAKAAINSAYWQLLPFLKPGDEKTKAVLEELQKFL